MSNLLINLDKEHIIMESLAEYIPWIPFSFNYPFIDKKVNLTRNKRSNWPLIISIH